MAGGLRAAGVQRGDRVTLRRPNGVDWVLSFWGIVLAGAVVVPINTRFTESEVEYVRSDSGAAYYIEPGAALPDGEPAVTDDLTPGDLAAIFYTSGTTGFPKGAMTSHANFLANVESAIRCVGIDRAEGRSLATLINVPLFHVTGANSQLLVMAELGGRTYTLANPLDLDAYLTTVSEEGVQMLTSVPAIYHALTRHPRFAQTDLSHVRWVSYGGAPIAAGSVHAIMEAFPEARVGNGFGLTETSSLTSFLPHEEAPSTPTASASRCRSATWRSTSPIPETGVGELLVRGENVVWATGTSPRRPPRRSSTAGCTPVTSAASTTTGCCYIVDRAKDMINRGGENVYSIEVEARWPAPPGSARWPWSRCPTT